MISAKRVLTFALGMVVQLVDKSNVWIDGSFDKE
jgi:hypothetical protein